MKLFQLYKYAAWGLFVLNLSMIAFFFLATPHRTNRSNKKNVGKKWVLGMNFTEQQDKTFLSLANQHMEQMNELNHQQKKLLQPYFDRIINPGIRINSDSLLQEVQTLEQKKIESTYLHFQEVKAILKPEQYPEFEKFVEKAIDRILLVQEKQSKPKKRK